MAEEIRSVNITPSPAYLRRLKSVAQESIETYQHTLARLEALLTLLQRDTLDPEQLAQFSHEIEEVLYGDMSVEAVTDTIAEIQDHLAGCQEGIAELEQCGY